MNKLLCKASGCLLFIFLLAGEISAQVIDGNHIMDQDMGENLCALTFDDGPSPWTTPELLDLLAAYNVRATFFMLGKNAFSYPEIVRRAVEEGHEIANHSWSHPNMKRLGAESQAREIANTDEVLRSIGAVPLYFRPPYGAFDERTAEIVDKMGLSLILWSMDSYDWKRLPEDYAKINSTRGTVYDNGALRGIFLFHDIHKRTVDDLPRIIAHLKAGGCDRFVTVSEYLAGLSDAEPSLRMSRRSPRSILGRDPGYALTRGPARLARCSRPWKAQNLDLEDAHAARDTLENVH